MTPTAMAADQAEREAAFREEVRSWLAVRLPIPPLPLDDDARHERLDAWQRDLFDAGFCGLSFLSAYGGGGLSPVYDAILLEELGARLGRGLREDARPRPVQGVARRRRPRRPGPRRGATW